MESRKLSRAFRAAREPGANPGTFSRMGVSMLTEKEQYAKSKKENRLSRETKRDLRRKTKELQNKMVVKLLAGVKKVRLAGKFKGYPPLKPFQLVVHGLTQFQRQSWARAKYPGLPKQEVKKVQPFTELKRT